MLKVVLMTPGSKRMAPAPPKSLRLWHRFNTLITDKVQGAFSSHLQVTSASRPADLVRRALNWEWQGRGQFSLRWGWGGQAKSSGGVNSRDSVTNKTEVGSLWQRGTDRAVPTGQHCGQPLMALLASGHVDRRN